MHSIHITIPGEPHNFTLTYIHSQLSSFAYSTKPTHQSTQQPLVMYHRQITAGLSQTCHHSHSAAPTLSTGWWVLKVPVIITIRFGETNVLDMIYFNIYQFWKRAGGYMVHPTFICLLFIKSDKLQEHDLY